MKKTLYIALSVTLAAVALLFVMSTAKRDIEANLTENRVWQHRCISASPDTGSAQIPDDCAVGDDFVTHLPILVVDTDDIPVVDSGAGDSNPYVDMTVTVIDSETSENRLSDAGTKLIGKIKVRGGDKEGCKFQFKLKLLDTFRDAYKYPLLGMAKADEWILDGCAADNSCLRNYLAYNLAAEMGLNSPDVRFCELVFKKGDSYEYMGLYLAAEPVEQGKGRVEFKGKRSLVGAYSYIVKRDGEDTSRPLLKTWAYEYNIDVTIGASDRVLTLVYPKNKKATEAAINYVTDDLSNIERILYSDNVYSEAAIKDCLNVDSFVDYFLLNEFMMNRDAGKRSTYMYKDIGGKLTMGPVWGFNDAAGKDEAEAMTMDTMPMFSRLVLNSFYTSRLNTRWKNLRSDILSDERLKAVAEETLDYLGNAVERDHCRREAFKNGVNTTDSSAEKLIARLTAHAAWLDDNLPLLSTK